MTATKHTTEELRNQDYNAQTIVAGVVGMWRDNTLPGEGGLVADPYYFSSTMSNLYRAVVWACYHYGTAQEITAKQSRGHTVKLTIGAESLVVKANDSADHREWISIL